MAELGCKLFEVSESVRAECLKYDAEIRPGVTFGSSGRDSVILETPVCVKPGIFDVNLIGAFTYLGDHQIGQGSFYRDVDVIGRFCSIAGRIAIGSQEHPTDCVSPHILFGGGCDWAAARDFRARNPVATARHLARQTQTHNEHGSVCIGNDVWIGEGVYIRRGVTIGNGAVIASHAVVSKDVPPYAIVGGVPAKLIRYRFAPDIIDELLRLQWWCYGLSALEGADLTDMDQALRRIEDNIASGLGSAHDAPILHVSADEVKIFRWDVASQSLVPNF